MTYELPDLPSTGVTFPAYNGIGEEVSLIPLNP